MTKPRPPGDPTKLSKHLLVVPAREGKRHVLMAFLASPYLYSHLSLPLLADYLYLRGIVPRGRRPM